MSLGLARASHEAEAAVARGGGRGVVRASHKEEEASHEEEWARRDGRFGPTCRRFERRRVAVARRWQRGRPKTNVTPKSVHVLLFLVVGDTIMLEHIRLHYFFTKMCVYFWIFNLIGR